MLVMGGHCMIDEGGSLDSFLRCLQMTITINSKKKGTCYVPFEERSDVNTALTVQAE